MANLDFDATRYGHADEKEDEDMRVSHERRPLPVGHGPDRWAKVNLCLTLVLACGFGAHLLASRQPAPGLTGQPLVRAATSSQPPASGLPRKRKVQPATPRQPASGVPGQTPVHTAIDGNGYSQCSVGRPPFDVEGAIKAELGNFLLAYGRRPGDSSNKGGTGLFHALDLFTVIRTLKPKHVIESGAFRGLGTWMIRQACGDCQIIVVSPEQPQSYVDPRADSKYFTGRSFKDFPSIDWDSVLSAQQRQETLVFFDDHQAHIKRLKQAQEKGFTHVVFDDNYPTTWCGDSTSSKNMCDPNRKMLQEQFRDTMRYMDNFAKTVRPMRDGESLNLFNEFLSVVDAYVEMPPLFFPPHWFSGGCAEGPTRIACFCKHTVPFAQLYKRPVLAWDEVDQLVGENLTGTKKLNKEHEAAEYTFMVYLRLKPLATR